MALPPSRALFGVPSSAISAPSSAAWSAASQPDQRRRDLAVHVRDRAAHVEAAEARRRRRAGRPPRREPRRGAGRRDGAADGAAGERRPRPRPSAGRASPRRGGRGRRAMRGRAHAAELLAPRRRAIGDQRRGRLGAASGRATRRTRSLSASVGEVFDRRLAVDAREEQAGQQRGRARLELGARLPGDAREIGLGERVEAGEEARARAAGVHRHFSSRWFRQKARSKAGSPYQAHSASRNTGPLGPDQDVLRADVAVHERALGRARAARRGGAGRSASAGMAPAVAEEIGLEADRMEDARRSGSAAATSVAAPSRRGSRRARSPTAAAKSRRRRAVAQERSSTGGRRSGSR